MKRKRLLDDPRTIAELAAHLQRSWNALARDMVQVKTRRLKAWVLALAMGLVVTIAAVIASAAFTMQNHAHLLGIKISPASGVRLTGRNRLQTPDGQVWAVHTAGRSYSLGVEAKVFRFEIRPGDRWPPDGLSDRSRSEISGLKAPSSGRSTIAYDVFVQTGDFRFKGVQHVIGQRHGKADAADSRGEHPVIAFRLLDGGRPALTVSGSSQQPLRTIPKSRYAWIGPAASFRTGKWHAIMIDSLAAETGWVDLWVDGRLMRGAHQARHTYEGPLGYANARADYWKFGDYCARGVKSPVIVYVRNIKAVSPPGRSG